MSSEVSSESNVIVKQEQDTPSKVRAQKRVKELSEAGAKVKKADTEKAVVKALLSAPTAKDLVSSMQELQQSVLSRQDQISNEHKRQGQIAKKILPVVKELNEDEDEASKFTWWITPSVNSDINTLVPDIGKTKLRVRGDLLLAGGSGLGACGNEATEEESFRSKRVKTEPTYGFIGKYKVSKQTLIVFENDDEKVAFQPEKIQLLLKTLTEQRAQASSDKTQSNTV